MIIITFKFIIIIIIVITLSSSSQHGALARRLQFNDNYALLLGVG